MKDHNQDKAAAEAKIRAAIERTNQDFKDDSLGTKIDMNLVGDIEHLAGKTLNANNLDLWRNYLKHKGSSLTPNATHVLFTSNNGLAICVNNLQIDHQMATYTLWPCSGSTLK